MEYEQLQTLATVRGLGRIGWDALCQFLVVEVDIRHREGQVLRVPISLHPEVATELWTRLDEAIAEKEGEEPNTQ